jgi:RsiW-degrading membrane proteinase PrsW (M82 family)
MIELGKITVSLFPVLALLATLIVLDSYKLVTLLSVLTAIGAGIIAAGLAMLINGILLRQLGLEMSTYSRYVAPVIEELLKSMYVIVLIRRNRVGFIVDAAIYGFAVGAGFALVENFVYLLSLDTSNVMVWIIRGFGTGAIHASTMMLLATMSKAMLDRRGDRNVIAFVPGLILAIIVHSLYNHFLLSPTLSTIMILIVLPLLVITAFDRSERATRAWLGSGFDADQELLRMLTTGEISESRIGKYLTSLQSRFPGTVVVDMFCYLRLHTELALRAKGILMLRQAGIKSPPDPEMQAKFEEMRYLERSIGTTGKLAITPFLHTSDRDLWQLNMVK